jgi:hypothetical protein
MMRVNPRWSDKWIDIAQTQAQAKKSINMKADFLSCPYYTHYPNPKDSSQGAGI